MLDLIKSLRNGRSNVGQMSVKCRWKNIKRFPLEDPNQAFYMDLENCAKWRSLPATGTPTYKLAKFFVFILSTVTIDEFPDHDSFSFVYEITIFCPDHFLWQACRLKIYLPIILCMKLIIFILMNCFLKSTWTRIWWNDLRELLTLSADIYF